MDTESTDTDGGGFTVTLTPTTGAPLAPPSEGAEVTVLLPRRPDASATSMPARYGSLAW
jgi:hypothetical protein